MMRSRSRSMVLAGVLGAIAGMYLMNMLDERGVQRQIRYGKRRAARTARSSAHRLSSMYQAGKQAVSNGVGTIRH